MQYLLNSVIYFSIMPQFDGEYILWIENTYFNTPYWVFYWLYKGYYILRSESTHYLSKQHYINY